MKGNDECNALEDEWLPVRAKEDEISLYEKLCQSIRIYHCCHLLHLWSESQVSFHLKTQTGEAKRKRATS